MIHRIKIKNFRSLDVDVVLDPLTVLIGRSGAGKTNFVDALRTLRNYLQGHQQYDNVKPITGKADLPLEYEITFGVDQLHEGKFTYVIKTVFSRHSSNQTFALTEEKLTFGNSTLFHRTHNEWVVPPPVHGTDEYLNQYPAPCIALLKGNQKISIAYIALSTGIGCYDFPSHVCRGMEKEHNSMTSGLSDDGKNVNAIFDEIKHDLTRIDSWNRINDYVRVMNDTIETIDQTEQRGGISVTHRFGNMSVLLPIRNESEGVRRFLAHLLAFHQKPPKQIMVFEEPERGIYPAAFAALAGEMKNCYSNGQGQVVLTTHSPEMLNLFEPENIRVVEMQDGITRIGGIAKEQMEALRENLLYPRELLTVEDARLDAGIIASEKEVRSA